MGRKAAWLAAAFVVLEAAGVAFAAAPVSPWGDREFWQSFDWSNLEESPLWLSSSGPEPNDGKSPYIELGELNYTIVKGVKFKPRFASPRFRPQERLIIVTGDIENQSSCRKSDAWLREIFGNKFSSVSIPVSLGDEIYLIDRQEQWIVGSTVVTSTCLTMTGEKGFSVALIKYESSESAKRLSEPVMIECTVRSGSKEHYFAFKLDDYNEVVRKADNSRLDGELTENRAVTRITDEDGKKTMVAINRLTGRIVISHDTLGELGTGTCTKSDPTKRRF